MTVVDIVQLKLFLLFSGWMEICSVSKLFQFVGFCSSDLEGIFYALRGLLNQKLAYFSLLRRWRASNVSKSNAYPNFMLSAKLSKEELRLADVASITIVLRDMSDYAAVNKEYIKHFSKPNPPSRQVVLLSRNYYFLGRRGLLCGSTLPGIV